MSKDAKDLITAVNEVNPVVCDVALGDLIFHYELAEEASKYVNGETDMDDSFALQRQNSNVVYKKMVAKCKRLDDNPNWVEVEFNDIPKCGKYQLYYQPGVKKKGELVKKDDADKGNEDKANEDKANEDKANDDKANKGKEGGDDKDTNKKVDPNEIFIEKVERLPLFNDFVEFTLLEQGYQDEYEEIVKSDLYQDESSNKNSDQE